MNESINSIMSPNVMIVLARLIITIIIMSEKCEIENCKKKVRKERGGGGQKFLKKRCKIIFEQPLKINVFPIRPSSHSKDDGKIIDPIAMTSISDCQSRSNNSKEIIY